MHLESPASESEINELEQKAGYHLPEAIKTIYRFFGSFEIGYDLCENEKIDEVDGNLLPFSTTEYLLNRFGNEEVVKHHPDGVVIYKGREFYEISPQDFRDAFLPPKGAARPDYYDYAPILHSLKDVYDTLDTQIYLSEEIKLVVGKEYEYDKPREAHPLVDYQPGWIPFWANGCGDHTFLNLQKSYPDSIPPEVAAYLPAYMHVGQFWHEEGRISPCPNGGERFDSYFDQWRFFFG